MGIENPKINKEERSSEELQKLLNDAEFRKEEAREFSVPGNVDFSAFEGVEDEVARTYERLNEWLKIPYTFDNFGSNHIARRKWRHEFDETEFSSEVRNSKMRANVYVRPVLLISILLSDLEKGGAEHTELIEKINDTWEPAKELMSELKEAEDSEERRVLLEGVEDAVVQVLNLLAEASENTTS